MYNLSKKGVLPKTIDNVLHVVEILSISGTEDAKDVLILWRRFHRPNHSRCPDTGFSNDIRGFNF